MQAKLGPQGADGDGLDGRFKAQIDQYPAGIGAQLDACADLAQDGRLFQYDHVMTGPQKAGRSRKAP
jgi:hypothetical protein